jgi:hypothetical protein
MADSQKINWSQIDTSNVPNGFVVDLGSNLIPINKVYTNTISTSQKYLNITKDLFLHGEEFFNPDFDGFRIGFGGDNTKKRNTVLGRITLGTINSTTNTNTGDWNSAIGYQTLKWNTSGYSNAALGAQTLLNNSTGRRNTGVGNQALYFNTTGEQNTAIGCQALFRNTTGYFNVAIGDLAGFNDIPYCGWTDSSHNVFIGYNVAGDGGSGSLGYNTIIGTSTGRGIVTGAYNTIIGAQVSGLSGNTSNNIILADGQGNIRIRSYSTGNVGIGTTSDNGYKLDVEGRIRVNGILEYSSNSAALSAGLIAGAFYRTGEFLKVVY